MFPTSAQPMHDQQVLPVKTSLVGLATVMAFAVVMLLRIHHPPSPHDPALQPNGTQQSVSVTQLSPSP